jgi:hypothetical protein
MRGARRCQRAREVGLGAGEVEAPLVGTEPSLTTIAGRLLVCPPPTPPCQGKILRSAVAAIASRPISLDGRPLLGRGSGFQQGLNRGQQFGLRGRLRKRRYGGPLLQDVVAVEAGEEQERHGLRCQCSAHGTTI